MQIVFHLLSLNSLNEGKTKYTFLNKSRQKDNIPLKPPMLAINGTVTEWITLIKFVGILLDEHLSWKHRISIVENKVPKISEFYIKPKILSVRVV